MKLTDEQRLIVEENHNLIYWYLNMRKLSIDEWYGIMAIELCKSVIKHDASRGSLSNYFRLRADSILYSEYKKSTTKKRSFEELPFIENLNASTTDEVDEIITRLTLLQLLEKDDANIVRLKLNGYTQKEIASMLNITQGYVSRKLKKLRGEFNRLND